MCCLVNPMQHFSSKQAPKPLPLQSYSHQHLARQFIEHEVMCSDIILNLRPLSSLHSVPPIGSWWEIFYMFYFKKCTVLLKQCHLVCFTYIFYPFPYILSVCLLDCKLFEQWLCFLICLESTSFIVSTKGNK